MTDQLLGWLRWVNIALGLLCLLLCLTKAANYWPRFNPTARGFTAALALFSFAAAWGTAEQLAQHVIPGTRTVVTTCALANLLYALWRTRGTSFYAEFRPENRVR